MIKFEELVRQTISAAEEENWKAFVAEHRRLTAFCVQELGESHIVMKLAIDSLENDEPIIDPASLPPTLPSPNASLGLPEMSATSGQSRGVLVP